MKEFLGEKPKKTDIATILSVTVLLTAVIVFKNSSELSNIPIWKSILFLIIVLDIIAGAMANFTKSTQQYYSDNTKKRVMFLLMHIVHIGLIYLSIGYLLFCVSILIFALFGSFVVNFSKTLKQQEINASIISTIGCVLFYVVFPGPQILLWLPAVIFIKLVFGFSIQRESDSIDP